jgi:hypothetical protein
MPATIPSIGPIIKPLIVRSPTIDAISIAMPHLVEPCGFLYIALPPTIFTVPVPTQIAATPPTAPHVKESDIMPPPSNMPPPPIMPGDVIMPPPSFHTVSIKAPTITPATISAPAIIASTDDGAIPPPVVLPVFGIVPIFISLQKHG